MLGFLSFRMLWQLRLLAQENVQHGKHFKVHQILAICNQYIICRLHQLDSLFIIFHSYFKCSFTSLEYRLVQRIMCLDNESVKQK